MQKASDDGEPGGTAGVPMHQMLLRRDMRCVAASSPATTAAWNSAPGRSSGRTEARSARCWSLGTRTRRRFRLATVTVDHQRAGKVQ